MCNTITDIVICVYDNETLILRAANAKTVVVAHSELKLSVNNDIIMFKSMWNDMEVIWQKLLLKHDMMNNNVNVYYDCIILYDADECGTYKYIWIRSLTRAQHDFIYIWWRYNVWSEFTCDEYDNHDIW